MGEFHIKASRILIIGASGLLGTHLVEQLSHDHFIIGASRTRPQFFKGDEFYPLDVFDPLAIEAVKKIDYDFVLFLVNPRSYLDKEKHISQMQSFISATISKLKKADQFIYFSSIHANGSIDKEEIFENFQGIPLSKYGQLHRAMEDFLHPQNICIVRPSNIYGFKIFSGLEAESLFISSAINECVAKSTLTVRSLQDSFRDYVFIDDFTGWIAELIHLQSRPPLIHLISGTRVSTRFTAELIAKTCGDHLSYDIQIISSLKCPLEKDATLKSNIESKNMAKLGMMIKVSLKQGLEKTLKNKISTLR